MQKIPHKVEKILVIRYRYIGDTVLTVPFLRNLKYQYPDAKIDMLIEAASGEFLKYCPYIDRLIAYEFKNPEQTEGMFVPEKQSFWGYINFLKKQHYDVTFVLKRSFSSALIAYLAGIPYRIGFNTEFRGFMLTTKVNYDTLKHEAECFLDLLRAVDIPIKDNYLESWTGDKQRETINNLIQQYSYGAQKKVIINASTTNPGKMWPAINYSALIEELVNNFDCQIFFLGLDSDEEIYEEIKNRIIKPLKYPLVSLIGRTNLIESVEFISRMDLVISIDSGILHLAASANTPTIAIFGPMSEIKWAPYSLDHSLITAPVPCRPCNLCKKCDNGQICLTSISYREVLSVAAKYLKPRENDYVS